MSRKGLFLAGLIALFSNALMAKDPISWVLNHPFPNPITGSGDLNVQYTLRNELPFTLVNPLYITKNASSAEFSFNDQCTGKKLAPSQTCFIGIALKPATSGTKTVSLIIEGYDKNQVPLPALTTSVVNFSVGGSTNGLQGTLVLLNNGTDAVTLTADGTFIFPTSLPSGSDYSVTIQSKPANQFCEVVNGVGTINNTNVTNVQVICSVNAYKVGGTLSGLAPQSLVQLQLNGSEILPLTTNGSFTFMTYIPISAPYSVKVFAYPFNQYCNVVNGVGTMGNSNVTDIQVVCSDTAFPLGGNLTGLALGETVKLNDGFGDIITLDSNGIFDFPFLIAQGLMYNVTVAQQPITQTCNDIVNGSGIMTGPVSNVAVTCKTNDTTLTACVGTPPLCESNLALSVSGLTEFGVPPLPPVTPPLMSGKSRTITITNTGNAPAINLSITNTGLPAGTSIAPFPLSSCVNGADLAAHGSCTITIVPGATATTNGATPCNNGTAPIDGKVFISANNTVQVSTNVLVLGYGCIYQQGYVFAFDDNPPPTASVSGKVVSTFSRTSGIFWSATSSGQYDGGVSIWGTADTSTSVTAIPNGSSPFPATQYIGQVNCNGSSDGSCNTNNISVYYDTLAVPYGVYAAGYCKQITFEYSGWYLPAICEFQYGTGGVNLDCGLSTNPKVQNMQTNLMEANSISPMIGDWWSSTVPFTETKQGVLYSMLLLPGNVSTIGGASKGGSFNVKCARVFNP